MFKSAGAKSIHIPNRIIYWILIPVVGLGCLFVFLFIRYTTPNLTRLITEPIDSNLKLASELGLETCENRFNYLLELRLENDMAMNAALKNEALEEIKTTSQAFPNIHTLVLQSDGEVVGSSLPLMHDRIPDMNLLPRGKGVISYRLLDRPVRLHHRSFPFWNWRIITYIDEKDYLGPVRLVERSIYVGTLGLLLLLTITLTVVFRRFVTIPLTRLIAGTRNVAEARYQPLPEKGEDEIGQLVRSFNQMMERLSAKDNDVDRLLRELRQAEKRFRTLFESAPIGFGLMDFNGCVLEANAVFYDLIGVERNSINEALSFHDFFLRREEADKVFADLTQKPSLERYDSTMLRLDEHWRARLTVCSYLIADKPVALIIAEDVSRERKLKAQLQRAQKMEAIGSLAGGVAHDLNNILAATVGYPEMLLMDLPEDDPIREPLSAIKQSGEKAARIVQDLLTMARRGVSVSEVVNLNRVVDEYRNGPEYMRLKREHPAVDVRFRVTENLLNIMGSPVHLSKTLMNLVTNAAEALPDGGLIDVTTENRYVDYPIGNYDNVPEGDYAVLTVADQGVGISEADLERIFEPFFTRKRMGESGTGLGMAVVYGTVKDHEGFIDVYSEVRRGTRFTLYFPVTREKVKTAALPQSLAALKGDGKTVLVVDDIEAQRRIAADMLTRLGYRVITAASGEEAVAHVRKQPPDILVLDMLMEPGIDGLETYRRIIDINPGQRGIITSGFSETERVRAAEALGIGAYLKKPFTLRGLGEVLQTLMDNPK